MNNPIDSLESALELKLQRQLYGTEPAIRLSTADCCVECQRLIESSRQVANSGTDVCELCAGKE